MINYKYLEVKPSKNGRGVFTKLPLAANACILEFKGDIIPREKLYYDMSEVLQIGNNSFLGPSGELDDYVNHSCNPNCLVHVVGNRAFLYSLYMIPSNTEITFDYSTCSTDSLDAWKMNCNCGAYHCRKVISGYQYLSTALQQEYKDKGMLPIFITKPGFYQIKWK